MEKLISEIIDKIFKKIEKYEMIRERQEEYIDKQQAEIRKLKSYINKTCGFCCLKEDGGIFRLNKKGFYAGYSEQLDGVRFSEKEIEEVNFCPVCGRRLEGAE